MNVVLPQELEHAVKPEGDLEELGAFIAKDNPASATEAVRQLRLSWKAKRRQAAALQSAPRAKTFVPISVDSWLSPV